MKIRKMNAHRARLSHTKPTGYGWKYKAGRRVLLMWNTLGRGVLRPGFVRFVRCPANVIRGEFNHPGGPVWTPRAYSPCAWGDAR